MLAGYLMPELFFYRKCSITIQHIAVGDEKFHTFPKSICPKLNIKAWLEIELA